VRTIKSRNVQYSTGHIKSIIYDIIYKFSAMKHDRIQYMLMRQKWGDGGEKIIGNSEDSTGYIRVQLSRYLTAVSRAC